MRINSTQMKSIGNLQQTNAKANLNFDFHSSFRKMNGTRSNMYNMRPIKTMSLSYYATTNKCLTTTTTSTYQMESQSQSFCLRPSKNPLQYHPRSLSHHKTSTRCYQCLSSKPQTSQLPTNRDPFKANLKF